MIENDERRATITSFTTEQGFGAVETEHGQSLSFDASVAMAAPADLRVGARVMVRGSPGQLAGALRVKALWIEGRSAPPVDAPEEPASAARGDRVDPNVTVSPAVAFLSLRGADLLTGVDLPGFEALCAEALAAEAQRLADEQEDDEDDEPGDDDAPKAPLRITESLLFAVLGRHYSDAEALERDEVLLGDENDEFEDADDGPAAIARARPAFERLCGERLEDDRSVDSLAREAGDILFRKNGAQGPLLFSLWGQRADTEVYLNVYVKRASLPERVRGLPLGLITTFVSPDEEKRATGRLPR